MTVTSLELLGSEAGLLDHLRNRRPNPNITQFYQSGILQLVHLFQNQLTFKKDGGSILKTYKETQKRLLCLSTASVRMKHNYQMVFMFVLYKQDGNNTFICLKQLYITTKDRKDFLNLQIFCHFFPPILRVFIYFLIYWNIVD